MVIHLEADGLEARFGPTSGLPTNHEGTEYSASHEIWISRYARGATKRSRREGSWRRLWSSGHISATLRAVLLYRYGTGQVPPGHSLEGDPLEGNTLLAIHMVENKYPLLVQKTHLSPSKCPPPGIEHEVTNGFVVCGLHCLFVIRGTQEPTGLQALFSHTSIWSPGSPPFR